jgi:AraC family transcriptional regulator
VYDGLLEPGSDLADYWRELFHWGALTNLVSADSLLIGIAQDDPSVTSPEKARFDVCVQVPAFCNPTGNVGCQTIASGLYGVARHYGPFSTLAETYRALYEYYIGTGKYRLRFLPPFEVYSHTRARDDLKIHFTDVYLPLEENKHELTQEGSSHNGKF